MSSQIPAKSIWKQPKSNQSKDISDEQEAKLARDRRNFGIALFHANKIQSQKDVTARILAIIEILLEFPAGPKFTQEEAIRFTNLIQLFQPSDFDDLVEERRTDSKCGYTLCPRSPRSASLGESVVWRLGSKGAGDYCSNTCMKKALYIRTQLSEVPAWERESGQSNPVVLPQEDRCWTESKARSTSLADDRRVANSQELAFERGETAKSVRPDQVMADAIIEKTPSSVVVTEPRTSGMASHRTIEGFEPREAQKLKHSVEPEHSDSDDDEISAEDQSQLETYEPPRDDETEDSWRELYRNLDRGEIS